MRGLATIAATLLCVGFAADAAQARDKWEELGCQEVNIMGADRDVIHVGRREGRFKAIRLSAKGNDVEMLDLKVVYASGAPDDIPVRAMIRQGSQTRALDLRGHDRAIKQINIVYKKPLSLKGLLGGKAKICAEGRD